MKTILAAALAIGLAVAGAAPAAAQTTNPRITLVNDSSQVITVVEMSDIDNEWGDDLLGIHTLPVGYQLPSMEPYGMERGYCRYDLRVTFGDGEVMTINDFNACLTLTVHVHDASFDIEEIDGDVVNRRGTLDTL